MSRFFFRASLIAAAMLALLISVLNSGRVEIEVAFARFGSSLGVALVIAFVLGLLAGLGWQARWVTQLLSERGRLRRALRIAESKARDVKE